MLTSSLARVCVFFFGLRAQYGFAPKVRASISVGL